MALTLPTKAEVQAGLASLEALATDLQPLEAFLPSNFQTAIADGQKVLKVLEAAATAL